MAKELSKGDVVCLKVGGPKMVVNHMTSEGTAMCVWAEGRHVRTHGFASVVLALWPLADEDDV